MHSDYNLHEKFIIKCGRTRIFKDQQVINTTNNNNDDSDDEIKHKISDANHVEVKDINGKKKIILNK